MSTLSPTRTGVSPRLRLALRGRGKVLVGSLGFLYVIALVGLWVTYQLNNTVTLDVGTSYARPYLYNFEGDEQYEQVDFAYATRGAVLTLPGPAAGPYWVRLRISGWRPDSYPAPVLTLRSGDFVTTIPLLKRLATYELLLPATAGDLSLSFESDLYAPSPTDPRELGIALDWVAVQGLGALPPLTTTALILGLVTLLWWFGLRVGLTGGIAALLVGALLVCLLAGLIGHRLLITVGLGYWVIALMLLHLLLWPLQRLMQGVLARHKLTVSPVGWRWLWTIFGLALLFKLGGALYPHAIFIDEWPHTQRVAMVLDGNFGELYRPGFTSYMGATVGLEQGYMPYSPLWYLIIAPMRLVGLPTGDAMNGLNALLDVSKGLLIFLITLATLRRERAAVLASGLYQLFPMPYFLLSWGNYPTQFGLWASLLAITYLALNYHCMPTLRQWRPFGVWVALLVLVVLSYTMIGVLTFTLFGILMLINALRGIRPNRQLILALVVGMLLSEGVAFVLYHYQFASAFVSSTIPSVVSSVAQKANAELRPDLEVRASPLSNLIANTAFLRSHTTDLMLILTMIGMVWLFIDSTARRYWALWSAWLAIFVLYTLVSAYVADMVLKHIFFVMPLICVSVALVLDKIWGRWRYGGWAVSAGLLALFMLVVDRWYFYLLIKRH